MTRLNRLIATLAMMTAGVLSFAGPAVASSISPTPSHGTTYTCPNGETLADTLCTITTTTPATSATTGATTYTCPNGGTLAGTVCDDSSTYTAIATVGATTYTCNGSDSLSGTLCNSISTYAATTTAGTTSYSCPSGGSLSGTTCNVTSTYAATYTQTGSSPTYGYQCNGSDSLSGSTCTSSSSYAATGGYTCPSGGSYNVSQGKCQVTVYQPQTQCTQNGYSWYAPTSLCYYYTTAVYAYSCPSGGNLAGSTCNTTSTYAATYTQTGSSPTYGYVCNGSDSLSGTTCTATTSYPATATAGSTTYTCNGSDVLSGTTCTSTLSYPAIAPGGTYYTCANGVVPTGTNCVVTSTYPAVVATSTQTYTASATAADGQVVTVTSAVSLADAEAKASAQAKAIRAVTITPGVGSPTSKPSTAITLVGTISNAPTGVTGIATTTLYGPVAPPAGKTCADVSTSTWHNAPSASIKTAISGQGALAITAPPALTRAAGCYAWAESVAYSDGAKANAPISPATVVKVSVTVQVTPTPASTNAVLVPSVSVNGSLVAEPSMNSALHRSATAKGVGIYDAAALTSGKGTAVIVGHVEAAGAAKGALFAIAKMKVHSTFYVTTSSGKATAWVVTSVARRTHTAGLPASLFGTSTTRRVIMVSVAGAYSSKTHHYEQYVIVTARPKAA